jgi:DNA-binding NarL/FixJ family response regulator
MPRSDAPGLERIARICREHRQSMPLRSALLEEIRRAVPFDAHVWLMTDPTTEVGSAPHAVVPCFEHLPLLIRLKYLTVVNRWSALDAPVATLHATTSGALRHSLVWRELLHRYDVVDIASMVFRDRNGCWAFLDLWRTEPRTPFSASELTFLREAADPITAALRASQAHSFADAEVAPARTGPVVLVLSADLHVRGQTAETDDYLRTLIPTAPDRLPVPAAAYNVAAQLLATEARIDDHAPTARVHLSGGRWLTMRAARITGDTPSDHGEIAVSIELASPSERLDLFARAYALTARETDLLTHLATGAATREIAARMYLAELTVQDHCKSIFHKTGVRTRSALLARCIGR